MKNRFLTIIIFLLLSHLLSSCGIVKQWGENSRIAELNRLYQQDAHYISIDSVYNTPEKRQKFEELKEQFLKVWLDSGNCFIHYNYQTGLRDPALTQKNIHKISIGNILHTPGYDTVLVLVSWYSRDAERKYVPGTRGSGWTAIIDSTGKWNFHCVGSTPGISTGLGDEEQDDDDMEYINDLLRQLVVKGKYLTADKKQDPTFLHRVFTDEFIWSLDWGETADEVYKNNEYYQKKYKSK